MKFFGGSEILGGFGVVHQMQLQVPVPAEGSSNSLPDRAPDFGRRDDVDAREFAKFADFNRGIAEDAFATGDRVLACG
ncbi:MAG: hypothetical protein WA817_01820 [Candidatus Acidiferrum sp.]